MQVPDGTEVGLYTVVEKIVAEGGMSQVYRVRHRILGSTHALKVLLPHYAVDRESRERFLNEGKIQARYRHPHIVPVTDLVNERHGEMPVAGLVMDWLDGADLEVWLEKNGTLPLEQAVAWSQQTLSALRCVHAVGVVHRDLKPGNIFIEQLPDVPMRVRVMDFGIAKVQNENRTRTRMAMGTPGYMSPEQIRSPRSVDHRTDLFAMGVILYEMLTGQTAFSGDSVFETMERITQGRYTPPQKLKPDLPPAVAAVIERALAVERTERFASASSFSAALKAAVETTRQKPVVQEQVDREKAVLQARIASLEAEVSRLRARPAAPPMPTPPPPPVSTAAPVQAGQLVSHTVNGVRFQVAPMPGRVWRWRGRDNTMAPFAIMTTPVTQALWSAVMGIHRSKGRGPNKPVEMITFLQACQFANRISQELERPEVYTVTDKTVTWTRGLSGFRLPTELEWEYACCGETAKENWKQKSWLKANAKSSLQAVAQLEPNQYGLYDMFGNVWEMCWDEGTDLGGKKRRIMKGGAATSTVKRLKSATRALTPMLSPNRFVGLRLVCSDSAASPSQPRPTTQMQLGEQTLVMERFELDGRVFWLTTESLKHVVRWEEAVAIANRLSDEAALPRAYRTEGEQPVWKTDQLGLRLPTVAELQASTLLPDRWEWCWDRKVTNPGKSTYQSALRKLGITRPLFHCSAVRGAAVRWVKEDEAEPLRFRLALSAG